MRLSAALSRRGVEKSITGKLHDCYATFGPSAAADGLPATKQTRLSSALTCRRRECSSHFRPSARQSRPACRRLVRAPVRPPVRREWPRGAWRRQSAAHWLRTAARASRWSVRADRRAFKFSAALRVERRKSAANERTQAERRPLNGRKARESVLSKAKAKPARASKPLQFESDPESKPSLYFKLRLASTNSNSLIESFAKNRHQIEPEVG